MSIRVSHGMARIELDSMDFRTSERISTSAIYPTDNVIEACRRVLLACDDARAEALADLLAAGSPR